MRRMESLPKFQLTAVAAGLGCAAVLGALLVGADAEGKGKKKKGGARVTSTTQSAILDAGAITLGGAKGKVVVRALRRRHRARQGRDLQGQEGREERQEGRRRLQGGPRAAQRSG